MSSAGEGVVIAAGVQDYSKAGYLFNFDGKYWQLDKNTKIAVGTVCELLDDQCVDGYVKTLTYYARNYSASHVKNINERFLHFLRFTEASGVASVALLNYRANLTRNNEWYLGTIRGFLKKWHDLGYAGAPSEAIELLDGWTIRGNVKGDVIKRLDPVKGPLSDLELQGFNEGAVQAFERGVISLTDMAMGLLISNTGRRPIQISHLRLKDILNGKNKRGDSTYLVNMPRAKQRATDFRKQFKQFAITEELWVILTAQAEHVVRSVEVKLGYTLQKHDRLELPLFLDMAELVGIKSPQNLRAVLKTDQLHIKSSKITEVCKTIADSAELYSERTGEPLNISSNRFRYTTGTRAAREGFGVMVIAELLDHSDTQNAGVYIENIPEHVESLDKAVGHQMARYAQAFSGVLVDTEQAAIRGDNLDSRVRADGEGIGTCGSYGFCGASVPIPCYTCMHFQPWLDGPHEMVYDNLIVERQRLLEVTGDQQIAAVNDRSILAVADVIQRCVARRAVLSNG
ncbi:MAG: recombinase [Methylococcales bacterium]|jgi:integrase|nr:recombinase [Methylococcales bacterium]MBT7446072.1 recombinase [Methylococcales bacterium]